MTGNVETAEFTRDVNAHGTIAVTGGMEIDLSRFEHDTRRRIPKTTVTLKASNTIQNHAEEVPGLASSMARPSCRANHPDGKALGGVPGVAVLGGGTVRSTGTRLNHPERSRSQ